jgi:hypothetical protein
MKKIIIIIFIHLKILIIINAKFNFNRKLISDEKKEKLCTEKTKYYELNNTYLSIKEYVSSLNIYEGNKRTFLLSLILDNKTNHLNDFLIEVLGYMFVICLSFLFLISKIIFI